MLICSTQFMNNLTISKQVNTIHEIIANKCNIENLFDIAKHNENNVHFMNEFKALLKKYVSANQTQKNNVKQINRIYFNCRNICVIFSKDVLRFIFSFLKPLKMFECLRINRHCYYELGLTKIISQNEKIWLQNWDNSGFIDHSIRFKKDNSYNSVNYEVCVNRQISKPFRYDNLFTNVSLHVSENDFQLPKS